MKSTFLYGIMIIGILIIPKVSYAQEKSLQEIITGEKDTRKEDNGLKFQTFFFEALKQKAINNYGKAIENLESCNQILTNNIEIPAYAGMTTLWHFNLVNNLVDDIYCSYIFSLSLISDANSVT